MIEQDVESARQLVDGLNHGWDGRVEIVQRIAERIADARCEGIRLTLHEGGLWCGECDPADPDDDCCVVVEPVRTALRGDV